MNSRKFLKVLPPFANQTVVVNTDQTVDDIVDEMLIAHREFASHYDLLIPIFKMPADLYQWLFDFCKGNINYDIEGVDLQSIRSPAGILEMGSGDCKHYASFIGGVLDALVRSGYEINWKYRFATYRNSDSSHVFIVVNDNGEEIWIDPVLDSLDQRYPSPNTFFDKKIKSMPLVRMSGAPGEAVAIGAAPVEHDTVISRRVYNEMIADESVEGCNTMGLVPMGKDQYSSYDVPSDFPTDDGIYSGGLGGGSGSGVSMPPVVATVTRADMIQGLKQETADWQEPWKSGFARGLGLVNDQDLKDLYTLLYENHFQEKTVPADDQRWQVWDRIGKTYLNFWPGVDKIYDEPAPAYTNDTGQVQYLVDGQPLVFPAYGARAALPVNLVIVYPKTYQGKTLPVDLPKPMVAGNRLVILPKMAWGVRDQLKAFDYLFVKLIRSALTPLIRSYSQRPDWDQENLYFTIWDDCDRADVVDYIQGKPVAMAFDWEILNEIGYFMNGEPLVFPADRNYNGNDYNGSHPPPIIADDLAVVYPDTYRGIAIPADLPRPIMNQGKLQLQPHGFGVNRMSENYYMWHSFLVSVMTPLIRSFAQYPYTGNNDLSERIWSDIAKNEHLENYLVAPDRKTFLGEVIEKLAGYVQEVTRLSLKVINAGSRLAFLGLVRINAFAFAYKLFLAANDPERKDKLYKRWKQLGGNDGDFRAAVILGCKNNPVFGGGVKQWIEDAVQDGVLDNGYTRPAGDTEIPEGQSMNGAAVGIAVADDVVYYMAAASAIIAALGGFLKGIGGDKTDKLVDDVIAGYDLIATVAGTDPIGTGAGVGAPVKVTDPATGQTYTINPPATSDNKVNPVMSFIKSNPIPTALIAAGVGGAVYLATNEKKKRATPAK